MHIPMTDKQWEYYRKFGLTERDGSVYACVLCGNKAETSIHLDWEYRCHECDPTRVWFWSHADAWGAGYKKALKDMKKSETEQ